MELKGLIIVFTSQLGFPCGWSGKESAGNSGDLGLIPGLGKSLEEGTDYPLQYSCLENSMNFTVHGVPENCGHDWMTFIFTFHKAKKNGDSTEAQTKCT